MPSLWSQRRCFCFSKNLDIFVVMASLPSPSQYRTPHPGHLNDPDHAKKWPMALFLQTRSCQRLTFWQSDLWIYLCASFLWQHPMQFLWDSLWADQFPIWLMFIHLNLSLVQDPGALCLISVQSKGMLIDKAYNTGKWGMQALYAIVSCYGCSRLQRLLGSWKECHAITPSPGSPLSFQDLLLSL